MRPPGISSPRRWRPSPARCPQVWTRSSPLISMGRVQVVVPQNHDLLIVVNNTGAGNVGVGDPFHLTVEGFVDTASTDPPGAGSAVPEPAAFILCATRLAWMGLKRR